MIDCLAAALAKWCAAVQVAWTVHGGWTWFFWFAPAIVFLEIPRYYLPLCWAVVMRLLRKDRPKPRSKTHSLDRRRQRLPLVSVVVAGRNEAETIGKCVSTLVDQDYPNLEVLVIDDHSTDRTSAEVLPYTRTGKVRLVRNNSSRGRVGRPSASNLGLRLARGEFLVSLDADTTFDRHLVSALVAQFDDPEVGVVAGNVVIRNWRDSFVARLQALEYAVAIDINKRWTDTRRATLQASGAVGAFRRQALVEIGGWEQQLGEDTDVSLRMIKAGWRLRFAPDAVARTDCPTTFRQVARQRFRWDRGGLRAFFKKHYRLLDPRIAGFWFSFELATEFLFAVVATLVYPVYLGWLVWQSPAVAVFVLSVCFVFYCMLSLGAVAAVAYCSPHVEKPWSLAGAALWTPIYKEGLRWVRLKATLCEILRINYEDPFLPKSAWVYAPRY
ncbi:MAG TPA: glycosyltransferase family 2 protein [Planctomycetota bacterium]|nr:glycosyltransferase family 2 protein [Planctomycetota bacterium]